MTSSNFSNFLFSDALPGRVFRPVEYLPAPERAELNVQFQGTFQLRMHQAPLGLPGGLRQRSMLAFLLYHRQAPIHRERIIRHFWPDHHPDSARNNLNVGICTLRRYLGQFFKGDIIRFENGFFYLHPGLPVRCDMDELLQRFGHGRQAEQAGLENEAAGWYRLATQNGCSFLEEFRQESWTIRHRQELDEQYCHALNYLGAYQQKRGETDAAIDTYRRLLRHDDCLEAAHRKLMECYHQLGQADKVVRQYLECEQRLMARLGMKPSEATRELCRKAQG